MLDKLTLLWNLLSYWGFAEVLCSFYQVIQLWLFLLQFPQHILKNRTDKNEDRFLALCGGLLGLQNISSLFCGCFYFFSTLILLLYVLLSILICILSCVFCSNISILGPFITVCSYLKNGSFWKMYQLKGFPIWQMDYDK